MNAAAPATIAEATADQPAARVALSAAAGEPFHAYLLAGPRGSGKAAAARALAAELLAEGVADPDGHPPAGARRPLAAPGPGLAAPRRHPAPRRGRSRAGDRPGRLPAVRGRAPGVRDRGRRGDGRGEPERAAEDARGAARVRASDPRHRRARGVAGDGALALPRRALRAASAPTRSRLGWPSAPPATSAAPPPGSPAATSAKRPSCSIRSGASCGRRSRS